MRIYQFLLLTLCNFCIASAQDSTLVTVKAGNRISETLTSANILLYPKFIRGIVVFKNDSKAAALMNYNSLYDQMLFIGNKGDTLALTDEKTIKYIAIDKDSFYFFDDGFLRVVASSGGVKLAEKRVWTLADVRKVGTHEKRVTTFLVTTFGSLTDGAGLIHDLVENEDLVLRKKPVYYFGDGYDRFVAARKKNLLSSFSEENARLAAYIDDNNINFDKKDDLEKLTQFLGEKK